MPGKSRFTTKEDRQAKHIADSEKKRGMSAKRAKSIGYATVNKQKSKKKKGATKRKRLTGKTKI